MLGENLMELIEKIYVMYPALNSAISGHGAINFKYHV